MLVLINLIALPAEAVKAYSNTRSSVQGWNGLAGAAMIYFEFQRAAFTAPTAARGRSSRFKRFAKRLFAALRCPRYPTIGPAATLLKTPGSGAPKLVPFKGPC